MNIDLETLTPAQRAAIEVILDADTDEEKPKKRKARKLPKALKPEEVNRLFAAINTDTKTGLRHRAIYETMYRAGLRVSEVCDLAPADVDLQNGKIYVQLGKGDRDRIVPIGSTLTEWLQWWADIRPQSDYFFCSFKGTQLRRNQLNATLKRLSEKSGVFIQDGHTKKPVSCHKLRHSYATSLLSKGLNLAQIQKLMGHKDLTTTQVYLHITDEELDAAIKALG